MLLGSIEQLPFRLLALLIGLTIHEFCHAATASYLGDTTARSLGRVSLNPVRHLDPMGTVMMLVVGFGWGKPVPVNHNRLAHGPRGMTLVAAAGPLSNLILAFLLAIPFKVGVLDWTPLSLNRIAHVMTGGFREGMADVIGLMIFFNLILAVFNLIPLAPLDGSKVVGGLIPRHQAAAYARLERNGPLILMGIILMDYAFGLGILWGIIGPVVDSLRSAAIG